MCTKIQYIGPIDVIGQEIKITIHIEKNQPDRSVGEAYSLVPEQVCKQKFKMENKPDMPADTFGPFFPSQDCNIFAKMV